MKRGFSLIELMISIALVALLVGTGTSVALKASQRKVVDEARRDFQGVLEQARANALAGKKIKCAEAIPPAPLAGWGVSIDAHSFSLNEYCGSVYGNNPKLIVTNKTYPNTITFTVPTCPTLGLPVSCFPIIFKPSGQGIRPSNMAIIFPASIRVTVTGFGFSENVDLYRSGQISAP